ncbi:MAG TPA: hypothetical protein VEI25_17005 [Paraburkholderia sp.]|nr:hypothetical protein [Paraburkholderia sp.]
MSTIEQLSALARAAEVCAQDYERRGQIVTPATAVGLWRAIARLAALAGREAEIGASPSQAEAVTRRTSAKRGARR